MSQSLTKKISRALTPEPVKLWMKRFKKGLDLRDSVSPEVIGPNPSPVTEAFAALRNVRGAFTLDDAGYFLMALRMQTHAGMTGDLLEIGCYFGRSTAIMAQGLAPGERLHICDPFENGPGDFAALPTEDIVRRNVARVNPGLAADRLVAYPCYSRDLALPEGARFRFIHIDGGHSDAVCYDDLQIAKRVCAPGGIIVVDDYRHPAYPGVTTATDRFLTEEPHFSPLVDVNRHGEKGRKLYLAVPR